MRVLRMNKKFPAYRTSEKLEKKLFISVFAKGVLIDTRAIYPDQVQCIKRDFYNFTHKTITHGESAPDATLSGSAYFAFWGSLGLMAVEEVIVINESASWDMLKVQTIHNKE